MSRKLPPLIALRVFESASRHLSFTRAADELCVTQAAVSHQIKALETWLGTPLFLRLSRSIKLTEAGESLAKPLTQALDLIDEASTHVVNFKDETPVLTIGMPDSFATLWALPRLSGFKERFPDISIRFMSKDMEDDILGTGDVDVEIRYGDGNWPNFHVYPLLRERVFPVCAPSLLIDNGAPSSLDDIRNYPLLHDVFSIDWKSFLEGFEVTGVNLRQGYGFNHSHQVIQACINGNGFALGREVLVAQALKSGQLVRPFKESVASEDGYHIVCRQDDSDNALVKAFSYWLLDEAETLQAEEKA